MAETELPPLSPEAKEALRLGHEAYDNKNYQEAIRQYEIYLKEEPEDSDILSRSAYIHGAIFQRYKEAEKLLLKVIELVPKDLGAYINLGSANIGLKEFKAAEFYLLKALDLAPKMSGILANLGLVYDEQGDLDKGEEYYLKALKRSPYNLIALKNLASLYFKRGDITNARLKFEVAEGIAIKKRDITYINDALIFIYNKEKAFDKLEKKMF
ncbi:tetratricopeptide repeat protein [Dysgonomonas macrotermitis]|uniref:Tetratricopeptide repeat-containing protein n=1 Tax=Dysgonomonas macrotermitis TaxID=1346286 RepID=A0A1M4ZCI1_9BACT|nr:tetratricopeptide repeat protein [Dysgonomonas macrotermitis]SHF15740.1 Tetratricopeptide repeat-containing protein [Dysgonomonas macrotermitis]